jgi:rhodanese-related sulfurtransferase
MTGLTMTTISANNLVARANREVEPLSAEDALARLGQPGTMLVDVRESGALAETGRIAGAVHLPRGFVEFQADPASPARRAELGGGRRLVLDCGSGNRSAPAAGSLNDMGLGPVAQVAGGFPALAKAGGAADPA